MKSISIQQGVNLDIHLKLEGEHRDFFLLLLNAGIQSDLFASAMISASQTLSGLLLEAARNQMIPGEAVSDNEGVQDDLPF